MVFKRPKAKQRLGDATEKEAMTENIKEPERRLRGVPCIHFLFSRSPSSQGPAKIGQMTRKQRYNSYINSPEWRVISEKCKERDGQKCVECGIGREERVLHAHHHRYAKDVHDTTLADLVTLCYKCHGRMHQGRHSRRKKKNALYGTPHGREVTKLRGECSRLQSELDRYKNENGIRQLIEANLMLRAENQRLLILLEQANGGS